MAEYVIIKGKSFTESRKKIKENKDKAIIFSSNDDELNRKILEKEKIDVLLLNLSQRKDKLKQRNSGFNHVLAKIAKKNNVAIGINLDEILISGKKEKAEIIARVRQNVKLCTKNKLKVVFISEKEERDSYDLKALGLVLGMPTSMVKNL